MNNSKRLRIAFIKFGGLAAGGTEKWLQMMAANLPREMFDIHFFYCDSAPYVNSDYIHADTDIDRLNYMIKHEVKLIKFSVKAKDVTSPYHDWVDTNFWEVFDPSQYDLIQTAKAGHKEYPYYLIPLPVVEYVTLNAGVDSSENIIFTVHLSQWQRVNWLKQGGVLKKSTVIPIPAYLPHTKNNLRSSFGISTGCFVIGFHQRVDNDIFSEIPLLAYKTIEDESTCFILMGGGDLYKKQAIKLGIKKIIFIPHNSDDKSISLFLNTLDVFSHGRRDGETFGTVFAEAMMHKKPCLSHLSKVANGHIETIGPAGYVAKDLKDYVHKLMRLRREPNLRAVLADKGYLHANEYYSLDACVKSLGNLYQAIFLQNDSIKINGKNNGDDPPNYGLMKLGFLYAGNLYEPSEIANNIITGGIPKDFNVHIMKFFSGKIDVMFDIGANTGLYGFVAAHYGKSSIKIHCYEPQIGLLKFANKSIVLNNWESKIQYHPIGLGDKKESKAFYFTGRGSSFNNDFNDNEPLPSVNLEIDTLDNQVHKLALKKVDFIKIDVNGFEYNVLKGAEKTIDRYKPILFVEIADAIKGRKYRNPDYKATLKWLVAKGYIIFRSKENFGELGKVNPQNDPGYCHIAMYLCIHRSKYNQYSYNLRLCVLLYKWRKISEKILNVSHRIASIFLSKKLYYLCKRIFKAFMPAKIFK